MSAGSLPAFVSQMRDSAAPDANARAKDYPGPLVETLINSGVVCTTAAEGELLLELYSLLECLEPDEHDVAARLSQVRFVPARTPDLGLYLLYIPLSDVLTHLVPASTLPQAQALH